MKTNVNVYDFERAFIAAGRKDNFSYAGQHALFGYLEQYEEDCGGEIELDVVALCCEYTEYENLAEFHDSFDKNEYPDLDTLRDYTQVIELENSDGFIIQDF